MAAIYFDTRTMTTTTLRKLGGQSKHITLSSGGSKQFDAVTDAELLELGVYPYGGQRGLQQGYRALGWTPVFDDGIYYHEPTEQDVLVIDLEHLRAVKRAAIQAEKVRARDGGFEVDGVWFDSDASARLSYLEFGQMLEQDAALSETWKASAGAWVTMDAVLFSSVQAAGEAHIRAVFAWQAHQDATLDAATTAEEIEAVSSVYETAE